LICGLDTRYVSRLIQDVTRPGRYCGNEINFPRKRQGRLGILLCFPDLYEIGMSNMGLRVLYHLFNREPDVVADLAFTPWVDMERFMRAGRLPLCGLGTGKPAPEFDVLAFSLQHELQYTNVLTMLDLAGVPLLSSDRRSDDVPLVIAGGPCAFNPEPMAGFVDAFVLGDGETVCGEISRRLLETKVAGGGRAGALKALADLDGVYTPRLHDPASVKIRRRVEQELREEDFPLPPIVPIAPITHDRLTLEIMRGCTRGCRFCSAGMLTRPVRSRDVDSVVRLAEQGIAASGWEELSLISLSTSEYADLAALVGRLNDTFAKKRVSISLPSMRPGTFTDDIARLVGRTKRTGLTFAPEAGSERLRNVINKGIDEADLYGTVDTAFRNGWDAIKLYFMIGLPTEDDGDAEALVRMVRSVESICRVYGRRRRITVSLSPFVPRPHTPFQWEAQMPPEKLLSRIAYIRKHLPDRRIKLKWRDPYMAQLEGFLARGDRSLGRVIMSAWKGGARFDGWTDRFDLEVWRRGFGETDLVPAQSLGARQPDERLPWDHIDGGVTRDFLQAELKRSTGGELTPDCRTGGCTGCGACPGKRLGEPPDGMQVRLSGPRQQDHARLAGETQGAGQEPDIRMRFRVRFAKLEPMRLASHLDITRCLQRGFRRAGLPVAFSKGFSPHLRMSFGPPLPLGMVGESEYFDVMFAKTPPGDWLDRFNIYLPDGLRALDARLVDLRGPSLVSLAGAARYVAEVWSDRADLGEIAGAIREELPDAETRMGEASGGSGESLQVHFTSRMKPGEPRAEKTLEEILRRAEAYYRITRKDLYVERDGVMEPLLPAE
jgi:radical SAM family uncharacterized protein